MKRKTIHIPENLEERVSKLAEEQGRSQAEIMRNGIYNELQKYEKWGKQNENRTTNASTQTS